MTNQRILVVDDDQLVGEVLRHALAFEGYEVRVAANGAEGLDTLRSWPANLILLDLMMPVMDGVTFRRQQLAEEDLAAVPVVVMSAARDAEERLRELHIQGYMPKPFDLNALLDSVTTILTA